MFPAGAEACPPLGLRAGPFVSMRSGRAYDLDVVAVGIEQERRVVRRTVVRAQAGLAVVRAAGGDARRVELVDDGALRRREREVDAGGLRLGGVQPQRG